MADLSPAEELRAAAARMREHHGPEHVRHEFWTAVADLLELEAKIVESITRLRDLIPPEPGAGPGLAPLNEAIDAIARAYLAGEPESAVQAQLEGK